MFIHFDSDSPGKCDNCETPAGTVMRLAMGRSDSLIALCVGCFRMMVQVLNSAAEKLRPGEIIGGSRPLAPVLRLCDFNGSSRASHRNLTGSLRSKALDNEYLGEHAWNQRGRNT
jgi:hypothetical protein